MMEQKTKRGQAAVIVQERDGLKITSVGVTYGRKQNLGDYSSANIEVTVWADVSGEDDATLDLTMRALWAMAKENVKSQLLPLVKKGISVEADELFLGLPVNRDLEPDQLGRNE